MIIDGHAHICGEFFKVESIISELDENGVDQVVLCPAPVRVRVNLHPPQWKWIRHWQGFIYLLNKMIRFLAWLAGSSKKLIKGNQLVYQFCAQYPRRLIQFYWVDPLKPQSVADMKEKFSTWHYKGIKLNQCTEPFKLGQPYMQAILNFAEEKKIPVFIHLYNKKEIRQFMQLAQAHDKIQFIVAHMIGLDIMESFASSLANVYFEISPHWLKSPQWILKALDHFGKERVIFGSDTPYGTRSLKNNLDKVKAMDLSTSQKEFIFYKNMSRLIP